MNPKYKKKIKRKIDFQVYIRFCFVRDGKVYRNGIFVGEYTLNGKPVTNDYTLTDNAGGMARELAAHDSESPTRDNG
jgi:hypothetical protein